MLLDLHYPADPYPGAVLGCSFVNLDGFSHPLRPDPSAFGGWRLRDGVDLDDWLAERGAAPMAGRLPVLAYGSNRCPSKITWLRRALGLTGPVVVLCATTRDVAAVWAAGHRLRDGQRPAVLAAAPGANERHAVWFATPDQVEVLDRCESRGGFYRLARPRVRVETEDGALIERPWCYLGLGAARRPLLAGAPGDPGAAAPVRCADLPQEAARWLDGTPAAGDGLDADEVTGTPHPDQWPAALFSYGLLRPGRDGWPLVAPHADGPPRAGRAHGTVHDTGLGWPALLLGDPAAEAAGTVIALRDPAALLPSLDDYEGPDYRRVRLTLSDGTVSWAYAWIGDRTNLR